MAQTKRDNLDLIHQAPVTKLLGGETIIYSDFATKINRKDRDQTRILLITDKAVYNIIPSTYKLKRRIAIDALMAVSVARQSKEFVLHVAEEYDYRYNSEPDIIVPILSELYNALTEKKLPIIKVDGSTLKNEALTKAAAKNHSHIDHMRRKHQFEDLIESDQEDQKVLQQGKVVEEAPISSVPATQPAAAAAAAAAAVSVDAHDDQPQDDADLPPPPEEDDDDESGDLITPIAEVKQTKVHVEDFELMKVLGRGSFGKVMQVRHRGNGKIYAMKILKKSAIVARNQVEHTRAEREILEALNHPFLMTLRWAFQTKDKLYFVLDYFTGGELFYHLKNVRRFPEDVAKIYIAEIASALGHLHGLGYIYRDLKPENILLDDAGHVCLTDFGLSKGVAQGDKAETFCGTPEYLAPEIVSELPHDKAVDWWALGILLYELTVGIPPFYDQNSHEMYHKIQRGILRFPPFLTENCKQLIVALLNRSPDKRLGSADDLNDIKNHPFYKGFDWDKLYRKEIDVPFKPQVKSADDASNFDQAFTNEPVVDSIAAPSSLANAADFNGFTFDPRANDSFLK